MAARAGRVCVREWGGPSGAREWAGPSGASRLWSRRPHSDGRSSLDTWRERREETQGEGGALRALLEGAEKVQTQRNPSGSPTETMNP